MLEVTLQPAIERSIADTLDGKEQGKRRNFTWMKFGLRVFVRITHPVIYTAEQFGDKVFGGHDSSLLRFGFGQPMHLKAKS